MKTYTEKLTAQYQKACECNNNDENYYHCATQAGVTPRKLDLEANDVFCAKETTRGDRPEYRLQAYLVREAKKNKWCMQIKDEDGKMVDWVLLDAERNFANTKSPKKFDLLAYSSKINSYIILELKKDRNALPKANAELEKYIGLLKTEISEANAVYGKNVSVKNVFGYLLCPGTKTNYNKNNIDFPYGVILFPATDGKDDQKSLLTKGNPEFRMYKKDQAESD